MRLPKPTPDPNKNAYLLKVAHRLKLDPHQVECDVTMRRDGGLNLSFRINGRDPNGPEERLIAEALAEEFPSLPVRVEG